MKLFVENFKSIEKFSIELGDVSIFIGPPASGKSNILDAIALAGYFGRLLLFSDEYGKTTSYLEKPSEISRFHELKNLFYYESIDKKIKIELSKNNEKTSFEAFFKEGKFWIKINEKKISWDLSPWSNFQDVVSKVEDAQPKIEARVYGYDRYGLSQQIISHLTYGENYPKNIMSEDGKNIKNQIKNSRDVILKINNIMRDRLGEKIEIKILKDGSLRIFDHDYEIDYFKSVSDTIFRIIYYLLALRSTINYVKRYGMEKKFIIMLEEPEAHVFPYFFELLLEYIEKVKEVAYVSITTHNPLFLSLLWDKIEVKPFYVYRDDLGNTKVFELDFEKLAKDIAPSDKLMMISPSEVVKTYGRRCSNLCGMLRK